MIGGSLQLNKTLTQVAITVQLLLHTVMILQKTVGVCYG